MENLKLEVLAPNPHNARRTANMEELAASIKEHGVLEPIIVRPMMEGEKIKYQIVCGWRRFEAAKKAGLEKIPAIVMDLSDSEAYEVSIIENLQRKDLEPYEEAKSFAAYLKSRKDKVTAATELSEKLGIGVNYVLSRLSAMAMPEPVLKAWKSGKIEFGHVQQLMRLRQPSDQKAGLRSALQEHEKGERTTVAALKREIDGRSVSLKLALFDMRPETGQPECLLCDKNSEVQAGLFGIGDGKATCHSLACFGKKQFTWLKEHWKETATGKKLGTNSPIYDNGHLYGHYESFYDSQGSKKCSECAYFATIVGIDGKIGSYSYNHSRVCAGDKSCYQSTKRAMEAEKKRKEAVKRGEKPKPADPNAPRCNWHGAYFREQLYKSKLPEAIDKLEYEGKTALGVILACLVRTNREAAKAIGIGLKVGTDKKKPAYMPDDYYWVEESMIIAAVMATPDKFLHSIFRKAVAAVVMEGVDNFKSSQGFGVKERRLISDYLGIDLKKEWAMNEEFLNKKTTKEVIALIAKFKLAEDKKFQDYLVRKLKKDSLAKCKKSELVDLVLKSGVKLAGLVPDEILRKEA